MKNLSRQDRRFRWLSLSLSALFLLSLIGARYHMAQVSHVRCHKHGKPIHLSGVLPHHHPECQHGAVSASTDLQNVHHCALLALLTQSSTVKTSENNLAGAMILNAIPLGHGTRSHVSIPLLHQSPKSSPPA